MRLPLPPPSPQLVKLQPKYTRPPKPMRPPLPPPEDSFNPYDLGQAFGRAHWNFQINERSRMDVKTFFKKTRGSVTNLITKELQDLYSEKVQTTAWIQVKVETEGEEGSIIKVDEVRKMFNSWMTEVFQGSDLGEIIKEMFTDMKT